MLKEIFYLMITILIFLLIGVLVSITDIDYTVAKYYSEDNKTNKPTYSKKNNKSFNQNFNQKPSGIKVEIVNESGSKFILVDKGTTQLEVFAIMGGKVKNILTITNLLKIITNGDSKIDMR
ncbi:MAG: hypothetical protein RMJ37_02530 [Spirochaetia bacterium]|nr:hypothetical protein [Spirochaetota bacterium]MCX8096085.1 hypothetical protein [Spirochaetota bacterium]MDW8112203.1 hypothetical protein [Spirochaetia bacterium]